MMSCWTLRVVCGACSILTWWSLSVSAWAVSNYSWLWTVIGFPIIITCMIPILITSWWCNYSLKFKFWNSSQTHPHNLEIRECSCSPFFPPVAVVTALTLSTVRSLIRGATATAGVRGAARGKTTLLVQVHTISYVSQLWPVLLKGVEDREIG